MKFLTVSAVRVYEPLATLIGNRDHQGTFTEVWLGFFFFYSSQQYFGADVPLPAY
jgi:hypothetical protein